MDRRDQTLKDAQEALQANAFGRGLALAEAILADASNEDLSRGIIDRTS